MESKLMSFLNEKNIDEVLKKIKMKELVEYINKYIGENLEIGKKYCYNGRNSIHSIITDNIEKGLKELWQKYGIDYAMMSEFLRVSAWTLNITLNYEDLSLWESIGKYSFQTKVRKNASFSNSEFTLLELPKFELYYEIRDKMTDIIHLTNTTPLDDLTIYEVYRYMLEYKRQSIIARYQSEILSLKRQIADDKKKIETLENILI